MTEGIGNRLKEFVNKNFKTQTDFAKAMKKHPSFFTPYFNGKNIPGGEILSQLAEFGCDINWLLTGKEAQKPVGNLNTWSGDMSQSGSGHQIQGNISGESIKLKGAEAASPEQVDQTAALLLKIIEQKDEIIRQMNKMLEKANSHEK